jgi:hypothetical protein
VPSCTCPDAEKGNQCKHIVFVREFTRVICDNLCSQMYTDTC